MQRELFEGVEVSMGGKRWVVPALNLKQLKTFGRVLQELAGQGTDLLPMADKVADVIHAAMTRNYPNLTRKELDRMLDFTNLLPALHAALGITGLPRGEARMGSQ